MIRIYIFDTRNYNANNYNKDLRKLPNVLHPRISRYKHEKDRIPRLVSRLLIRKAIIDDCGNDNMLQFWKNDAYHKPYIKNWNYFNISHSDQFVVVAINSEAPLGIDIEKIDQNIDISTLASTFLTEEKSFILNSNNQIKNFYKIWAKKEAILKAIGTGIINGLDQYDCRLNSVQISKTKKLFLHNIEIDHEYSCYLALPFEKPNIHLTQVTSI